MNKCKIIMYHYVRSLKNSTYPEIKGLETIGFKNQLNYFKENNHIFSGRTKPTLIGNNNSFLSKVLIGHDVTINNNVMLYKESVVGRYCHLFDYSGIGPRGFLVQNKKVGNYGFVGMNYTCSRDVFPIFFDGGNVYGLHGHRFMRSLELHAPLLASQSMKYHNGQLTRENICEYKCRLPDDIYDIIVLYMNVNC